LQLSKNWDDRVHFSGIAPYKSAELLFRYNWEGSPCVEMLYAISRRGRDVMRALEAGMKHVIVRFYNEEDIAAYVRRVDQQQLQIDALIKQFDLEDGSLAIEHYMGVHCYKLALNGKPLFIKNLSDLPEAVKIVKGFKQDVENAIQDISAFVKSKDESALTFKQRGSEDLSIYTFDEIINVHTRWSVYTDGVAFETAQIWTSVRVDINSIHQVDSATIEAQLPMIKSALAEKMNKIRLPFILDGKTIDVYKWFVHINNLRGKKYVQTSEEPFKLALEQHYLNGGSLIIDHELIIGSYCAVKDNTGQLIIKQNEPI
jgi:hypothetical protein